VTGRAVRSALATLALLVAFTAAGLASEVRRFTDAELIDGFVRTVFGAEYDAPADAILVVKRFTGPVRVRVEPLPSSRLPAAEARRRARQAEALVRTLASRIHGLRLTIVPTLAQANLLIAITDRASYRDVGNLILHGRAGFMANTTCAGVPSWRRDYSIERAVAIIPADIGERGFVSCVAEEFLQLLGAVNDDSSLTYSTFNDANTLAGFPLFDQLILNMLYDPRIRPGMTQAQVRAVLPTVIATVRPRVEAAARRRAGRSGRVGFATRGTVFD
jgi:hypothetical protein